MKNKDLIAELQKHDPDARICVYDGSIYFDLVSTIAVSLGKRICIAPTEYTNQIAKDFRIKAENQTPF